MESVERLRQCLEQDNRCLALVLAGSLGNGTADEHSDVDAVAVLRDEGYESFSADLRPLLERLCGPIVGWLREGETADACNYAFLYRSSGDLLLYDFYVIRERAAGTLAGTPMRILFDRTGVFAGDHAPQPSAPLTADAVRQTIEQWWVYAYLNGKYLRRGDILKLLYVQEVLLHAHVKVLNAAHCPDRQWTWWARDLTELAAVREQMLVYFGATDVDGIRAALRRQMELFSQDARSACGRLDAHYHDELESAVRAHLSRVGV